MIPAYRAAAFIDGTLASVLDQTVPPDELIVVDDGSTDDTCEVVEKTLATANFPTRLIRLATNSGGPALPMNRGIGASRCDWIVALDHDDELLPSRIERFHAALPQLRHCGVVIGQMVVKEQNRDRGHLLDKAWSRVQSMITHRTDGPAVIEPAIAYAGLAEFNCYAMSCSAMAFPKAAWADAGGFDETLRACIDFGFLERVLRNHPLGVLDFPVAFWQHLPTNLSHEYRRRVLDISNVMQRIHDRCDSLPPRLTPKLRGDLLDRAYLLKCRGEPGAWRAWRQSLQQYGLRPKSFFVAAKMLVKRS